LDQDDALRRSPPKLPQPYLFDTTACRAAGASPTHSASGVIAKGFILVSSLLTTDRLLLRTLSIADAAPVFEYRSIPEVSRYQNWEPQSPSDVQDFISSLSHPAFAIPGKWSQFGIIRRESAVLIGDCGVCLSGQESRLAEIGITLNPAFQGKGYATETLLALLNHLFLIIGVHRVTGSVDPRNSSSLKLLKKVGMRQEAQFIESYWSKGRWVDDAIFAILKREWESA
jgi:RimJ/RimL family protein N-acetyltransferase